MPKASLLFYSLVFSLLLSSGRSSASYGSIGTDTAKIKQNESASSPTVTNSVLDTNHPKMAPTAFVLQPVVGLGVGMFSYFGNVKSVKSYAQNPTTARLGYTLMFGQKINEHFDFDLCALFGTLGQYVRSQSYNWNFQSQIAGGGIHVLYRILPTKDVSPFFTLGIESFNFLSKTDMKDQYGNKYYYWSDGSIRSLPQGASDASTATILTPDYSYETDIRSLDLDGSTKKYSEQTFAIPIGAGFMMRVTKKAEVSFGTTLHYTFTDHIDGLTPDVPGNLRGNTRHDMFLLTSVGIRYDLTRARHLNGEDVDESRYDTVKLDASLIQDTVQPVATDTTPISDSARARQYRMYKDSTGKYVRMTYDSSGARSGKVNEDASPQYMVQLGKYSKGVPSKEMDKMLSVPDVKSTVLKDSSSVYTAGNYGDYNEAKKRQAQLAKEGFKDTKIVYRKGNDFVDADKTTASVNETKGTDKADNGDETKGTKNPATDKINSEPMPGVGGVTFRVQLGAYKHKLTNMHMFSGAKNVIEVKTENDYYTYSVGSYINYKDAEAARAQLVAQGYSDAFVKAYRNGKRVSLSEAGAVQAEKENNNQPAPKATNNKEEKATVVTGDKKDVKFKVQLGVYKGTPPVKVREKFKKYKNLAFDEDAAGDTHYNVGPYSTYNEAKAMKEKAIAAGIKGAFVVAYLKDKPIPIQDAIRIMNQ